MRCREGGDHPSSVEIMCGARENMSKRLEKPLWLIYTRLLEGNIPISVNKKSLERDY